MSSPTLAATLTADSLMESRARCEADAALKVVQDDLDEFKRKNVAIIAANEAKEASDMAKAVLAAIGENTPDALAVPANASPATVKVSSAGVLTATQAGYTMSAAPEEIDGWRGRTLANDGDTTVIYTNIADAVATPIGHLYRSTTLQGKTAAYRVTDEGADESVEWDDVKRADDVGYTMSAAPEEIDGWRGRTLANDGDTTVIYTISRCRPSSIFIGPLPFKVRQRPTG